MRVILFLLAALFGFLGVLTLMDIATGSEAGRAMLMTPMILLFLTSAVLLSGAAVVDAIIIQNKKLRQQIAKKFMVVHDEDKSEDAVLSISPVGKIVAQEIEAGAIDLDLWQRAKRLVGNDDADKIRPEYMNLRIEKLSAQQLGKSLSVAMK